MSFDLESMSRKELEQLRADVDKALSRVGARELKAAREAAAKAAAEFGFSLEELAGGAKAPKAKAAAKYRNPADATQTWSGRGRKPQWIKDAEAAGTDIESFAI
ncbi:hypothetical protein BVC71_09685 [Marivivens niveibacter]|uniref:DNA-binding protein H-NS-like C-terminal domain-containing protein n=1 Tax=Marivivens niveibacter TaxID=1930667 RepID=A0A251WXA6_9RHOB|nr:H-NS histone family protein [Marivivens niveibacter]OUD08976.1 hypothetical protein BVC71_09685 [Marivivens niveibacter]